MNSRNQMTPVDFKDMEEGAVYHSLYPKWPKMVSGYFPFTVTKISQECVHVMFIYPVRNVAGCGGGKSPVSVYADDRHGPARQRTQARAAAQRAKSIGWCDGLHGVLREGQTVPEIP